MNATEQSDIARYVDGVRVALADLPPAARDELLEDLADHLAEVAAEGEGTLSERLGSPSAYAAELRASAGVGGPRRAPRLDLAGIRVKTRLVAQRVDLRVGRMLGYERASEFGRLLRPGWWVLRGYVFAMIFLDLFVPGPTGLLPSTDEYTWIWFAAVAAGVLVSVRLGTVTLRWRGWRSRLLLAGNAAIALLLLAGAASYSSGVTFTEPTSVDSPPPGIFPYDRSGRPIYDARLIDEYGNEVPIGGYYYCVMPDAWHDPLAAPCDRPVFPYEELPLVPDRIAEPAPSPTAEPAPGPTATPSSGSVPTPSPSLSVTPRPSPGS